MHRAAYVVFEVTLDGNKDILSITVGTNRKVTKTKSIFTSDTSFEKMLYLASMTVMKKWTQRYKDWDKVLSQLMILYGSRITPYM